MKIIKDQTFKEGFHVDRSPVDIQNLENVVVQRVAYTIVPFQEYKKKIYSWETTAVRAS